MIDIEAIGRQHVQRLAAGQHGQVYVQFDDTMRSAMSEADLEQLWAGLVSQVGPLEAVVGTRVERKDQLEAVIVTCKFERGLLDVRIVLDPERKIAGLFVKPADQSGAWRPPTYAKLDEIDEIELSVGAADWLVPGTFTTPRALAGQSGVCPAIVLVHGSGPHDRDETIGPNKPFKDLALGLASRGICVLRYEKRTKHHAQRVMETLGDDLTVKEETVDDALATADAVRKQAIVDPNRVFVLGHSLGGYAIPRIAKRGPGIAGFIILAGSTRPLEDVVLEQVRYISSVDGKLSAQEKKSIAAIERQVAAVKALDEKSTAPPSTLPLGIGPKYWLDLRAHDPAKLIAEEVRPILVMQGARDYQVTLADFSGWKNALKGQPNSSFKQYEELNHLFIAGAGKSTPAEYQRPGHVDVRVVNDIAAFITSSPQPTP